MQDPTERDLEALTAEPDQLDGHTIDELADYLDAGRTPPDPAIENSAACRHALAALERLRAVSAGFLADRPVDAGPDDDAWTAGVLSRIAADAHAGADFLVERTADGDEIVMTEGALRAIVRAAGDDEPGFLVGRVRFTGDLADPDGEVVLALDVVVAHGTAIPAATRRLRQAVLTQVRRHTRLRHPRIDITVQDLSTDTGA